MALRDLGTMKKLPPGKQSPTGGDERAAGPARPDRTFSPESAEGMYRDIRIRAEKSVKEPTASGSVPQTKPMPFRQNRADIFDAPFYSETRSVTISACAAETRKHRTLYSF
jgi:hypothetical protein